MAGAVENTEVSAAAVARIDKLSLGMSWWGLCSAMFYLFIAASLAMRYGPANALIGMTLAAVTLAVLAIPFVRYVGRTGHSSMDISMLVFGRRGATIAPFLLFSSGMYFAVFEGSVLATTVVKALPFMGFGVACALIVIGCFPLMTRGAQQALACLNAILFPVYLVGLAALFILSFAAAASPGSWLHIGPSAVSTGWWPCFIYYLSQLILLMITIDFARLARSEDLGFHAAVTFGAPFYLMAFLVNGFVGIVLAGSVGISSLTETAVIDATLLRLGALGGLAFVAATQTRINAVNFFVSAANLRVFAGGFGGHRMPTSVWPVLVGGAVLVLMRWTNAFGWLLSGSFYLSVLAASWVGVALVHVLRSDVGGDAELIQKVPAFRAAGLIAWLGGVAVGLALGQMASLSFFASVSSFLAACFLHVLLGVSGSLRVAATPPPEEAVSRKVS